MSTQVQYRRGTGSENDVFTGAVGEITVDTTNWTLRIHDGSTAGGAGNLATVSYVNSQVGNISTGSIANGTSNVTVVSSGGNITVGVADSEIAEFSSSGMEVTGNVLPAANVTYDLGSSTRMWNDVWIGPGSLYVDGQKVLESQAGTIVVTADEDQSLTQKTTGTGVLTMQSEAAINLTASGSADIALTTSSGQIEINGDLALGAGKSIISGDAGPISVADPIDLNNNTISNVLTVTSAGNVSGGNLTTSGAVDATGNITAGNLITGGDIDAATGSITTLDGTSADFSGNVDGGNINSDAQVVATGNVTGANFITAGDIDAATGSITTLDGTTADFSGNVDGGNINSDAQVVATGNVTGANFITAGVVDATGNVTGGNLITASLASVGTLATSGNATIGGNLTVSGNITYINVDDLRVEDPIIVQGMGANGATLTSNDGKDRGSELVYYDTSNSQQQKAFQGFDNSAGNMISAANVTIADNVVTVVDWGTSEVGSLYAHDAITTDTTITATGNITGANFITAGDIDASTGSITTLDGTTATFTGNVTGANLITGGAIDATGNIETSASVVATTVVADTFKSDDEAFITVADGLVVDQGATVTGNITGGNFITAGDIDAATGTVTTLDGTLATYTTGNITTVNATTVNTTDVVATGDIDASTGTVTTLDGTTATFTGNVQGGNLVSDADVTTVTVTASGNIDGANLNTTGLVDATGNITGGNVAGTRGAFTNIAGTLETAAQTNITSVGTLSSLSVTGNVTGGNFITGGLVEATGNIETTGGVFVGDGSGLTNIPGASGISNGTSNVSIPDTNGNVKVSVNGKNGTVEFGIGKVLTQGFISNPKTISETGVVVDGDINALMVGPVDITGDVEVASGSTLTVL